MVSSSQVKRDDGGLEEKTILDLVNGDKELEAEVQNLVSKNREDQHLLFDWELTTLGEFWNKAVAYGAGGGPHAPPPPIFGGNHPVGPATPASIEQMQRGFLLYLSSQVNPSPQVIRRNAADGGTVGLKCSAAQSMMASGALVRMEHLPWSQGVLATGAPLTGSLAKLYTPCPKEDSLGACNPVHLPISLWT
jgi:hypothetical protein